MVLLELFSGIGGFSLGLEKAGFHFDKLYFSEIDRHAIANFKYNYPYAEYIGKVETVIETGIERPNIITFGSPCQDFSVAGIGKGLGGDRSSLISYAIEVIRHFRPDVFIWENVKGVLFTRHRTDLFTILKAVITSNGNCLIRHGFYPKIGRESTLSDVCLKNVPDIYFLSEARIRKVVELHKNRYPPISER